MSSTQTTFLNITGMTCGGCARHVTAALRGVSGVSEVTVEQREGRARVTHDVERAPVPALLEAVRASGYGAAVREGGAA